MQKKILFIIKFIIVTLSVYFVFISIKIEIEGNVKEIWSDRFTISPGEKITFYCNPFKTHKANIIKIYDINDNPVDSIIVDLGNLAPPKENQWLYGRSYSEKIDYYPKLKPGLYHAENSFTFSIYEPHADWVIVIPHLSYLSGADALEANFYKPLQKVNQISDTLFDNQTQIPFYLTYFTPTLKIGNLQTVDSVIKAIYPNKTTTFVSDFNLFNNYYPTPNQHLVFMGNFTFATSALAEGINRHQLMGGKVLIAASNLLNNRVRINNSKQLLEFFGLSGKDWVNDSAKSAIRFNDELSNQKNYTIVGGDYQFADKPDTNVFTLTNWGKSLLPNDSSFSIFAPYFNGIPLQNMKIDFNKIKFQSGQLIATIPCSYKNHEGYGTIGILRKHSGTLVFLPTEKWFEPENQNKNWVKNLTLVLFKNYLN